MERRFKTYSLQGEPETRLEQEFDNFLQGKADAALVKKLEQPNPQVMPQSGLFLLKTGGVWKLAVRIEDTLYKVDLTAI